MKTLKRKTDDKTPAERARAVGPLDSGETRAIMIGAVVLFVFLYFIKLILLPFVLAAIVAYICTPFLDWAARRTQWPRSLFAVGLFLVLVAVTGAMITLAAKRLIAESKEIAVGLQGMLETFVRQAEGDRTLSLFGLSMNTHDLVQTVLARVRDWIGQTDQIALLAGYGLAAFMGAFLAIVLLFYFLADGKRVAAGLFWIVPPHRRPLVARIWARLDPILMRYFIGVIVVVAYATVAAYIGLGVILGIKQAVFLALLTGILEIVPFVGPTAAAVIAGLGVAAHGERLYQHPRICRLRDASAPVDRPDRRSGCAWARRPRASGADYLLFSGWRHCAGNSGCHPGCADCPPGQKHLGDNLWRRGSLRRTQRS